jgi:hypothetical protein
MADNQTNPAHLKGLTRGSLDLGTGLFAIPAPDIGILEFRVVAVEHLTYEETAKRGDTCRAFKWIPEKVRTFKEIDDARKAGTCNGSCGFAGLTCYGDCVCVGWHCN